MTLIGIRREKKNKLGEKELGKIGKQCLGKIKGLYIIVSCLSVELDHLLIIFLWSI